MLLRQSCFINDLLTHIKENKDFLWQKPWQLLSSEANFEGCSILMCLLELLVKAK